MQMERLIKRLAVGLLALVAVANAALFAGISLTRDPAPRPLDGQRIFVASRPAVVLVQANYQLTASVPEPTFPKASQDRLERQLVAMVESGRLPYQEAAIKRAAVDLLLSNPDAYFVPGSNRISDDVGIVSTGSGFFVTEDGYLVTAAHVVSAGKDDIRAEIVAIEKEPAHLAATRKAIRRSVQDETGLTLNDSQLDTLVAWQQGWAEKYLSVDTVDVRYYLASGTVEAGQHLVSSGSRLSLVTAEPVTPGRDVAVMKADVSPVPALALATRDPKAGAATYVVGYPRRGYLQEDVQMDATVPATLSSGAARTQVSMDGGWTAFGTDAEMTHGNSGGPVLDAQGRVLGMASFIEADSQGKQLSGQGYFVPAGVIRETLSKASVKPAPGTMSGLYSQALSQGDFHHYKHELAILSQVQARSSWASYVKDDVSTAQSAVLSGKDQTPPELRGYVPAGAAAAGVATVLAMAAGIWLRLRRRAAAKAAAVAATASAREPARREGLPTDVSVIPTLELSLAASAEPEPVEAAGQARDQATRIA